MEESLASIKKRENQKKLLPTENEDDNTDYTPNYAISNCSEGNNLQPMTTNNEKLETILQLCEKLAKQNQSIIDNQQVEVKNQQNEMHVLKKRLAVVEKQNEKLLALISSANSAWVQSAEHIKGIHEVLHLRMRTHTENGHTCQQRPAFNASSPTAETIFNVPAEISAVEDLNQSNNNGLQIENRLANLTSTPVSNKRKHVEETVANNSVVPKSKSKQVVSGNFDVDPTDETMVLICDETNLKIPISKYMSILMTTDRHSTFVVRLMNILFDKATLKRSSWRGTKDGSETANKIGLNDHPTMIAILKQTRRQFPNFIVDKKITKAITMCCSNTK